MYEVYAIRYATVSRRAADTHIIPGHDPLVAKQYPAMGGDGSEIYCLHQNPL